MPEEVKLNAVVLPAQEIFALGTWNGDSYSEKDLDNIIEAFYKAHPKVPLKLGHDEAQKWFGQKDGFPAMGWVESLRRVGDKLVGDFHNVPEIIANLIRNKAYRGKSAEIYWNIDLAGKQWPRVLKAVSLLGADLPAVSTLNDLGAALYSNQTFHISTETVGSYGTDGSEAWKTYTLPSQFSERDPGGKIMTAEKEKEYTDKISAMETKLAAEKKRADEAEARAVGAEAKLAESDEKHQIEQFSVKIDSLVKDGKVLPSEKEGLVRQFAALGSGLRKYGGKEYDPREELLKSLEARVKKFSFRERGAGGEGSESDEMSPAVAVDKLAKKYMAEKNIGYTAAVGLVKDSEPELWSKYLSERGGK